MDLGQGGRDLPPALQPAALLSLRARQVIATSEGCFWMLRVFPPLELRVPVAEQLVRRCPPAGLVLRPSELPAYTAKLISGLSRIHFSFLFLKEQPVRN